MRPIIISICVCMFVVFLASCNQNRIIPLKAALVYKMGPQPVARTKFYLLRADVTKEKFKHVDGEIGDSFFTSPGFARGMTQGDIPVVSGLKEDSIKDFVIDSATTDFDGNTKFENVKPGTYWIVGYTEARAKDECVVWNFKVEINATNPKGNEPIILDQNNAYKISSF